MKHISEILNTWMLTMDKNVHLNEYLKTKDINKIYQDAIKDNPQITEIDVDGIKIPMIWLFRNYGHLIVRRSHCNEYLEMYFYGVSDTSIMINAGWSLDFLNKVKDNEYVKKHLLKP